MLERRLAIVARSEVREQVNPSPTLLMESLQSITEAMQPREFLISLDLTEAYLHILIFPVHRKYLRFYMGNHHL